MRLSFSLAISSSLAAASITTSTSAFVLPRVPVLAAVRSRSSSTSTSIPTSTFISLSGPSSKNCYSHHRVVAQSAGDEDSASATFQSDNSEHGDAAIVQPPAPADVSPVEKAWRSVPRPLLRIGVRGASASHGNSLAELLDQHALVKVKVDTRPFGGSLEKAFETLKRLAEEAEGAKGAAGAEGKGVELVQARAGQKVFLVGRRGSLKLIESGAFPSPSSSSAAAAEEES